MIKITVICMDYFVNKKHYFMDKYELLVNSKSGYKKAIKKECTDVLNIDVFFFSVIVFFSLKKIVLFNQYFVKP